LAKWRDRLRHRWIPVSGLHKTCNPCRQATAYRCPHFDRVDRQAMSITATSDNQILKYNVRNWKLGCRPSPQAPTAERFSATDVTECHLGLPDHSALMLAARITLPHFSVSSATSFPNSAGVIGMGSPASSARRVCNFGSANTAFTA